MVLEISAELIAGKKCSQLCVSVNTVMLINGRPEDI